ncbi:hypothetical protein DHEL01_v205715 [Diaporthe helianthi]|uniref:Uncharacterized protein n=1 Tax=Diaporthe helianthi TaxID=158607 RepID=A0A2P5I035_DIAHE|nr:hypothetical protein DHEL01_v205715 [Diaporthe helianthi]
MTGHQHPRIGHEAQESAKVQASNQAYTSSAAGQPEAVESPEPTTDAKNQHIDPDPPGGMKDYPWDGTWEEARACQSLHIGGLKRWTVATDLFILDEVPRYHIAAQGEKGHVLEQILTKWRKWNFGFEPSHSGLISRYDFLMAGRRGELKTRKRQR